MGTVCAIICTGCGVDCWQQEIEDQIAALQEQVQAGLAKPGTPGEQGPQGEQGPAGPAGADGKDGRDGVDGKDGAPGADGKDGRDGVDGKDGAPGADGKDGRDGVDGAPGLACWDLNGNGVGDLETEDINGDGTVDVADCQGARGDPGDDGLACWDLNGDGVGDVETEDVNGDGTVDVADCQGARGDPGVFASARISAGGVNLTPSTRIPQDPNDVYREQTGRYRVRVHTGMDVSAIPLGDIPVAVTPLPAFMSPNADADIVIPIVQPLDLDSDPTTLEFRIHMLGLPENAYRDCDFTFLLMDLPME